MTAPAKTTLPIHQETDRDVKSHCKFLARNATTRNIVDLLLVITILVLLSIAAPIIRGDHCGKFLLKQLNEIIECLNSSRTRPRASKASTSDNERDRVCRV